LDRLRSLSQHQHQTLPAEQPHRVACRDAPGPGTLISSTRFGVPARSGAPGTDGHPPGIGDLLFRLYRERCYDFIDSGIPTRI
jgi:hypothetical protein